MTTNSNLHKSSLFNNATRQIAVAFVCAVLYLQGFGFSAGAFLPVCMPSCGLALGAILLNQKKYLAGMAVGVAFAQIVYAPTSFALALILITGCLLQSFLGVWLLSKYKKFELKLEVPQSFLALCLVCLVMPAVSAPLLLGGHWLQLIELDVPVLSRVNQYWMGESVTSILMTSLMLVWRSEPDNWKNSGRVLEALAHFAVYFLCGQIIFYDWFHGLLGVINRGYWLFPLIVVVAVRIGRHGVIALTITTVLQALAGASAGKGFFSNDIQQSHLINLWNYSLALAMVGMTFSIILKNRLNIELSLRKGKEQLREAQKLAAIADWSWDVQNDVHFWSPGVFECYGRDPALGPAVYPDVKQYFTAESWARLAAAVDECLHAGRGYECDAEVVRPDGSHRWITARGEVVRDGQNHVVNMFGTVQDITASKQAQLKLIASESNFRTLFENTPTAMLIINSINGQILQVNDVAVRLWGYEPEEFLKLTIIDITYTGDALASRDRIASLAKGEFESYSCFEKRYVRKNGSVFWAEVCVAVVMDEFGKPLYNIGSIIDITERKQIEQQLSQLSMTVEQSPESIVITDIHANIEYVNESYLRKSGYSREELIGQNSRMLQSGSTPQSTYAAMWQALSRGETWEGEFINRSKDGYEYTEHAIINPIRQADGSITHYVAVKEDITEKLRSKLQLHRLAYYDEVTELPNFLMMQEHIDQALTQTRKIESYGALIILNIDRFQTVHDANGQVVSNLLLKSFGERLVQTLYASDVVARISGDEFCILLPDLDNSLQQAALLAMQISRKVHHCMVKSFHVGGRAVVLTACHGIAVFTGVDDDNPQEIVRRASTAMHHAKSRGYEQSVFFENALDQVVHKRFALEGELRQAISANELGIYLQSQVDSRGIVQGAEALIRWQHPRQGLISPAHFIGIAEESNLIIDIDNWVLNRVCQRLASLTDLPIRISVNISVRHFNQIDFAAQVRQILAQTGADPQRLTLEITEGIVIDNLEDVIIKMKELGALGIHFSMDDFGTGYSSLSYLKRLPINELKIDKSFIQEVTSDPNDAAMVEGILAVTRHLNLRVVAEGVETLEQAAFLNQRAQILHQGYLYSVPEPMESWLASNAVPLTANS